MTFVQLQGRSHLNPSSRPLKVWLVLQTQLWLGILATPSGPWTHAIYSYCSYSWGYWLHHRVHGHMLYTRTVAMVGDTGYTIRSMDTCYILVL
jgi:hypothetical protein